jgi:hypothetical protein
MAAERTFPPCGARTKGKPGKREPGLCKAAGAGIGGRCRHHGGMLLGAPGLRRGPRLRRQLVLLGEPGSSRHSDWAVMGIPLDLFQLLKASDFERGASPRAIRAKLVRRGVPRAVAAKWPQRLGFRIALLLSERGRIAFSLCNSRRDRKRGASIGARVMDCCEIIACGNTSTLERPDWGAPERALP